MSTEQPTRPPRRSGSNASPMGSTLAIVLAIAAVVVAFLILRQIRNDDDDGGATDSTPATLSETTQPLVDNPVATEGVAVTVAPTKTGATVLVANSSHQNRVAGQLTTALQGVGFTMAEATDGSTKETATKVQYVDGDTVALAVAQSVASTIGVDPAALEVIPTPPLLQDPALATGAGVIVLLGDDKAGKTLEQMTAAAAETPATGVGTATT